MILTFETNFFFLSKTFNLSKTLTYEQGYQTIDKTDTNSFLHDSDDYSSDDESNQKEIPIKSRKN